MTGDAALFTPLLTEIYRRHELPFSGVDGPVLIDFGEACPAPVSYEHAEIAAELFRFDPDFMRGYFSDTPSEKIMNLCFEGLLIHDFGGDILRRFLPAEKFTALAALKNFLQAQIKQ